MARYLPTLEATEPSSTADTHAQVRGWMENITSFSPFQQIDYGSYSTVLEWSSRPDLLPIVLEVIKKRLEQKGIGGDKAIILAQVLPTSALLTLVDPLKKLATPPEDSPHTLHTNIASHLLSQAETLKADNDKADLEFKWNAWAEVYGKPSGEHQFPPLPKEVEWGMWGLVPVTPEQWWTVPKEEAEDKA